MNTEILKQVVSNLKAKGVKGNYSRRENLHITLAFIGEYGNPDEVMDCIEQVDFKPFDIRLEGVDRKT